MVVKTVGTVAKLLMSTLTPLSVTVRGIQGMVVEESVFLKVAVPFTSHWPGVNVRVFDVDVFGIAAKSGNV